MLKPTLVRILPYMYKCATKCVLFAGRHSFREVVGEGDDGDGARLSVRFMPALFCPSRPPSYKLHPFREDLRTSFNVARRQTSRRGVCESASWRRYSGTTWPLWQATWRFLRLTATRLCSGTLRPWKKDLPSIVCEGNIATRTTLRSCCLSFDNLTIPSPEDMAIFLHILHSL